MKVNCICKKGQTAQVIVGNHDVIAYCTKCERAHRLVVSGDWYMHYNGTVYEVMCVALDVATEGPVVIYKTEAPNVDGPSIFSRPLTEFIETTLWPDNIVRPRFLRITKQSGWQAKRAAPCSA